MNFNDDDIYIYNIASKIIVAQHGSKSFAAQEFRYGSLKVAVGCAAVRGMQAERIGLRSKLEADAEYYAPVHSSEFDNVFTRVHAKQSWARFETTPVPLTGFGRL